MVCIEIFGLLWPKSEGGKGVPDNRGGRQPDRCKR